MFQYALIHNGYNILFRCLNPSRRIPYLWTSRSVIVTGTCTNIYCVKRTACRASYKHGIKMVLSLSYRAFVSINAHGHQQAISYPNVITSWHIKKRLTEPIHCSWDTSSWMGSTLFDMYIVCVWLCIFDLYVLYLAVIIFLHRSGSEVTC